MILFAIHKPNVKLRLGVVLRKGNALSIAGPIFRVASDTFRILEKEFIFAGAIGRARKAAARAAHKTLRPSGDHRPEVEPSKVNLENVLRFRSAIHRSVTPPATGMSARFSSGESPIAGLLLRVKALLTVCNACSHWIEPNE